MTDYQKLEAIYNEIDTLIANNVMAESPEFESWHSRAERFLVNRFVFFNFSFVLLRVSK